MPNESDHRRFKKITVRPGVDDAIEPEASLVQQTWGLPGIEALDQTGYPALLAGWDNGKVPEE
jgi:hypothetical protein